MHLIDNDYVVSALGLVANELNCDIVVSAFGHQSYSYVHFQ